MTIRVYTSVEDAPKPEDTQLQLNQHEPLVMERLSCLVIELCIESLADLAQGRALPVTVGQLFNKLVVQKATEIVFEAFYVPDNLQSEGGLVTDSDVDAALRPGIEELFHRLRESMVTSEEPRLPQRTKLVIRVVPERFPGESLDGLDTEVGAGCGEVRALG